ncbi:Scr1 family TA system antitoxin-like transcriptional regulator [Actinomadura sp. 9N407]|uniref:helix-turn-helix domain-containing protein n=1 Tax=Actinomadura sp. 9N407 TaxID=3375154 RepID=UPI00379108CD
MPRRPRDPGTPQTPAQYFGKELRAYREAVGLSRPALAKKIGYSPQWIGQVEAGDGSPSEELAQDCDTVFGTNGSFYRNWLWIQEIDRIQILPAGFRPFAEAERRAAYIRVFEPQLVPGILQTEEYAAVVMGSGQRREKAVELVAARMERQTTLVRDDPPWLLVLLSEAAVRRVVGSPEIQKRQLQRLLDVAREPNVTIQVIPERAPVYQASAVCLLGFEGDDDIGFVDGAMGHGSLVDEPAAVVELGVVFDQVRSAALTADDSECFIREVMEACDHAGPIDPLA